ncbi:Uncharacterised protein (plasmid) [Escherichia coli]|nr:Uncharacterised protein [Escherichia coli]SYX54006.1 Uncharacterised protein [Escherichia coli]
MYRKQGGAGCTRSWMMRLFFVCGADFLCAVGLQTCGSLRRRPDYSEEVTFRGKLWPAGCNYGYVTESCAPYTTLNFAFYRLTIGSEAPFRDFARQLPFHQGDNILTFPVRITTRTGTLYSPGLKLCLITAKNAHEQNARLSLSVHPCPGYPAPAFCVVCFPIPHGCGARRPLPPLIHRGQQTVQM